MLVQPHSVGICSYRIRMTVNSKKVLWQNVQALMKRQWGKENLTGFGNWVGIAVSNVQRIKAQKTSVGLDKKAGLEPWQLLVPDLDVVSPQILASDPAGMKKLIDSLRRSTEALSGALRIQGNTESGDLDDGPAG
jgi:hypothetical protein